MIEDLKIVIAEANRLSDNRYGLYVEDISEDICSSRYGVLNWTSVTPKGLLLVTSHTGTCHRFRPLHKGGYTVSRAAKTIVARLDHDVKQEIKQRNEIKFADTIVTLREKYKSAKFSASSSTLAPIEMTLVCTPDEAEQVLSAMIEVGAMKWCEPQSHSASPSSDPEKSQK